MTFPGLRRAPVTGWHLLAVWAGLILGSWLAVTGVMYALWRAWVFVGVGV